MVDDSARALATQDGRDLTYLEVGDPHGPLVIHNHGGPSSRFEARLLANSAGSGDEVFAIAAEELGAP